MCLSRYNISLSSVLKLSPNVTATTWYSTYCSFKIKHVIVECDCCHIYRWMWLLPYYRWMWLLPHGDLLTVVLILKYPGLSVTATFDILLSWTEHFTFRVRLSRLIFCRVSFWPNFFFLKIALTAYVLLLINIVVHLKSTHPGYGSSPLIIFCLVIILNTEYE